MRCHAERTCNKGPRAVDNGIHAATCRDVNNVTGISQWSCFSRITRSTGSSSRLNKSKLELDDAEDLIGGTLELSLSEQTRDMGNNVGHNVQGLPMWRSPVT